MGSWEIIEPLDVYVPWSTGLFDYDSACKEVTSLYPVFWGRRPWMGKAYLEPRHDEALTTLGDLMERFAREHKEELTAASAWHNSVEQGAIPINQTLGWPTVEKPWPVESFLHTMQDLHDRWSEIAHPTDQAD